ncbi:predicted protein [Aspergillus terreus NIH2624]|uniref:NACHT domain-containing protein n=1 Tax=Aspergillus terreus (strain NIH 2624 / FGSC A1156) TaxID=341663 RepID=Q0CPZ3_ASPTN|nr:uncharacterized protein ATEG_04241 [Aspergillus terreus NIH2624]EAU36043.1 predicted protein [Aspergillus terreus NIH2624]
MDSIKAIQFIILTVGTIAFYHLWRRGRPPARLAQPTRAVRLQQVYPPPENQTRTDIDIIAIHGLDTNSEATWVWDPKGDNVNWLKQSDMLPTRFRSARIFTCDWPADLFEDPDFVQKEFEEFARLLLAGIKSRSPATNGVCGKAEERPIGFIASCLGGVILMKALVMASHEYQCVKQATRGIIFLATPFRGTSFEDVARWAEPGLNAWASLRGKKISHLLKLAKSSFNLEELVRNFTALCQENDLADYIVTFYETGNTRLTHKVVRWLPQYLAQEKPVRPMIYFLFTYSLRIKKMFSNPQQLVSRSSGTLDIVKHPLALDRRHVLMNKFAGPHDPDYETVTERVGYLLRKIGQGRLIERADVWIRTKRYSLKELKIERLSGELLPMDRCYINLALVERSSVNASRVGDNAGQKGSPFSLFARIKTERPDKTIEMTLPALFEPHQTPDGQKRRPNRILIHGRAGVGKTTLCKKIVHDFTYAGMWQNLFDRVLWLPLRNLKREDRRRSSTYNFGSLFYDEYFSQHPQGKDLADAVWSTLLQTTSERILLILDGLDEVVEDLEGDMLVFFKELLDQPNVIVTSRPHAMLPQDTKDVDLRLETIGFYPDQLKAYVENAFTDRETGETNYEKVSMIQSYLQKHPLVQGLVRIPVQLDAFCFTWETWERSNDQDTPKTMTAVYQAIELSLWKKDAVKLGKLTEARALGARRREITSLIRVQRHLLEYLAFTGIYNNVIDFESKHCDAILDGPTFTGKNFLLDETLKSLSFLRTPDQSLGSRDQSYHFLHLTFQEYFAARYFVRQWKANKLLEYIMFGDGRNRGSKPANLHPTAFLRRKKYKSRYDIFWRFVAGLLNEEEGDEEASRFFDAIEAEPLDILGPTHQRLVMHCLSEIRTAATFKKGLEEQLSQWLLFECRNTNRSSLGSDMEFPVPILLRALREESEVDRLLLLGSLRRRLAIEPGILELVTSMLEADRFSNTLKVLVLNLLACQSALLPEVLEKVAALLASKSKYVREAAVEVLARQSALTSEILQKVIAQPEDIDWSLRQEVVGALARESALTPEILEKVGIQVQDEDGDSRQATIEAPDSESEFESNMWTFELVVPEGVFPVRSTLTPESLQKLAGQTENKDRRVELVLLEALTPEMIQKFAGQLENEDWRVKLVALEALASQSTLTSEIVEKVSARLQDKNQRVRVAAIEALLNQSTLTLELLEKVEVQLADVKWDTRPQALRALASQLLFTPDNFQRVTAWLKNRDSSVRLVALETLASQSKHTPEILENIATLLTDEDRHVRGAAAQVITKLAPSLEAISPYLDPFYRALLERSFIVPVSWFNADGFSYMIVDERVVSLGRLPCHFMEVIQATQRALGSPLSR